MTPTLEEIQKLIAENEKAISQASQAEKHFSKSVRRAIRTSDEMREKLRRAGLLRDPA